MSESIMENEFDFGGTVEGLSEEMDLDALLGIGADDVSGSAEEKFGEEADEVIDFPHIKVSARKFLDILRVASVIGQGKTNNLSSRLIGFEVIGDRVKFYTTDNVVYVEKYMALINKENILTDFVLLNWGVMLKMIKACPSVITIYKKDDKLFLKMIGGDFELDTVSYDKTKMIGDMSEVAESKEINSAEFLKALYKIYNISQAGVTAQQRLINVINGNMVISFKPCVAIYKGLELPNMTIPMKESKVLYLVIANSKEETFNVRVLKERVVFEKENDFIICYKLQKNSVLEELLQGADSFTKFDNVEVDTVHLLKVATLSSELPFTVGKIGFNWFSGGIKASIKTKRSNGEFILRSNGNGREPLNNNININSPFMKAAVRTFSGDTSLVFYLGDLGVGLSNGKMLVVVYTTAEVLPIK